MSSRLAELTQRKELLVARLQLQRMETSLRVAELRDAFRPRNLISSAIARPAGSIAFLETAAALFGLRRVARAARIAAISLVVSRLVRRWRGSSRAAQEPPVVESSRPPL